MAGKQYTNEQACDFIKTKADELARYMESLGFDRAVTGSVLLGIGAGWVAAVRGNAAAFECLDYAKEALRVTSGEGKLN